MQDNLSGKPDNAILRRMKYDTASKLWIEKCTAPFLKEILDSPIRQLDPVEELAQEQPSMAKADSVLKATLDDGTRRAFILGRETVPADGRPAPPPSAGR